MGYLWGSFVALRICIYAGVRGSTIFCSVNQTGTQNNSIIHRLFFQVLGTWNTDWEFEYPAITGPPPTGKDRLNGVDAWYVIIKPKEERKKVLGLFGGSEGGKKVFVSSREMAQKLARVIEGLRTSQNS